MAWGDCDAIRCSSSSSNENSHVLEVLRCKDPSFTLNELRALLSNFEAWIGRAADKEEREKREIMRDYVEMLVDTGARPGKELMDLKWNQIAYEIKPTLEKTGVMTDGKEEEPEEIVLANLNKTVFLSVSGKTGRRDILGRLPTVRALERIAVRNYKSKKSVRDPLGEVAHPGNRVHVRK